MHHADHTESPFGPSPSQPPDENLDSPDQETTLDEQESLRQFALAVLRETPRTYITTGLVLLNMAVFGYMVSKGVSLWLPDPQVMIEWGANFAPRTLDGELWRLWTCMFLHYGVIHVAANMYALWKLGRYAERLFGNTGYFLLYAISGLAASLAGAIWSPLAVAAGASGAIFGVAGALLAGTWKIRRSIPPVFIASARSLAINIVLLIAIYAVINHFQQRLLIGNLEHGAGLLAGMVCGLILAQPIPQTERVRRLPRNGLLAATAAAGFWLVVSMLPGESPADIMAVEARYNRVNERVNRLTQSAYDQWDKNAISDEQFADFLESDILPRWTELEVEFPPINTIPADARVPMEKLLKIIQIRQASLQLQIEAVRENNPQKQLEARKLLETGEKLMKELNNPRE